jgi:hypothetical protein
MNLKAKKNVLIAMFTLTALSLAENCFVGKSRFPKQLQGEIGMNESEISKLKSPIGLDLGGRTPEETAISIAAEIISNQVGGTNKPLKEGSEPIHKSSLASENEPAPKIN